MVMDIGKAVGGESMSRRLMVMIISFLYPLWGIATYFYSHYQLFEIRGRGQNGGLMSSISFLMQTLEKEVD
jgi:hypothetical protein